MGKVTTDNFHTVNGTEIALSIKENSSSVEITISNLAYKQRRNRKIRNILLHIICYGILTATILPQLLFFNIIFITLMILQINSLMNTVNVGE